MNTCSQDSSVRDDEYAIVVKNVYKRFSASPVRTMLKGLTGKIKKKKSDFQALNNISFEIKKGKAVGILGENGSGKSTLLQIIAKTLQPSSGTVQTNGKLAALLELGSGFNPDFTGKENIYLNGTILGMTKKEIDIKLDEIIDFSGVGKFIDTPVKKYSSGMRVRLAFSVAAHLDPEILLIDEVLAVGDAEFQKKCLGKMENISKQGRTILFVSHNMDAIEKLCNKCVLISDGSIEKIGITNELISNYLNKNIDGEMICEYTNENKSENALVEFQKVQIVNELGEIIKTDINKSTNFGIKIYFQILDDNKLIFPSINVYNNQGRHLFSSFQRNNKKAIFKPGKFVSTIWIPTNYFSNGYFNVSVIFFTPSITTTERLIQTKQILRFKINDPKLSNIKSQTDLNIPSSLIPEFNWEHHAF